MANLVPLIAFSLMLLAATCVLSQDSIAFTVVGDTIAQNPAALTFLGDAHVPTDSPSLRLTRTSIAGTRAVPPTWSDGRVLFSTPVQISQRSTSRQASIETTITFNITRSGNSGTGTFAFFVEPVGATRILPSSGTRNRLFAVEFTHPRNPGFPGIGIYINSIFPRTASRFDSISGQPVTAHISYDAITKRISVVAYTATRTYELSYNFDISTVLPEVVEVGVSGFTELNDDGYVFNLVRWSFNSTLVKVIS